MKMLKEKKLLKEEKNEDALKDKKTQLFDSRKNITPLKLGNHDETSTNQERIKMCIIDFDWLFENEDEKD